MKHLALIWADGDEEMKKFEFLFHLSLKSVQGDQSIEELIIKQHAGLKRNNVKPSEVKFILRKVKKVLVILDGYDEYKRGTNSDIDNAVTKQLFPHSWMILTSRESKELPTIREYFNAEAEIIGFGEREIKLYINKYFGDAEKSEKLLEIAEKGNLISGIYDDDGLMHVPILLHMICVLFLRKVSLPETRTGIMSAIVQRCPDWEEVRKSGKKRTTSLERALIKLGELIMKRRLKGNDDQTFTQVTKRPFPLPR